MTVLETILGIGNLVLVPAKGLLNALLGSPLWLKLDIGSVMRQIETGDQIRQLGFTLQMVNEEPSRPIRVDGVQLEIPALAIKQQILRFEGRLGNQHWSQSWPLHLRNDKAILRVDIDVTSVDDLPGSLVVKAIVRSPKGWRKKKELSRRLVIPGAN